MYAQNTYFTPFALFCFRIIVATGLYPSIRKSTHQPLPDCSVCQFGGRGSDPSIDYCLAWPAVLAFFYHTDAERIWTCDRGAIKAFDEVQMKDRTIVEHKQ